MEIIKIIQEKIGKQLSTSRAITIAITETHNAATYANLESTKQVAEEINLKLKKRWIPVEDSRTRPAHAAMDFEPPIELDEPFIVGGEAMMRPGDSMASARNIINCRCVMAYEESE